MSFSPTDIEAGVWLTLLLPVKLVVFAIGFAFTNAINGFTSLAGVGLAFAKSRNLSPIYNSGSGFGRALALCRAEAEGTVVDARDELPPRECRTRGPLLTRADAELLGTRNGSDFRDGFFLAGVSSI